MYGPSSPNSCTVQEALTVVRDQEVQTVVKAQEVLTDGKVHEVLAVVKGQEVLTDEKNKSQQTKSRAELLTYEKPQKS